MEGTKKYWSAVYDCESRDSFFKIENNGNGLCIADPLNCSSCEQDIGFVDCDSDAAAWFSYGNLHKTSPKAYYLYSARCWLNDGLIAVLATPSLEAKTCPINQAEGACERLEWNLDRFSKDVLYYEWSFNSLQREQQCSTSIF